MRIFVIYILPVALFIASVLICNFCFQLTDSENTIISFLVGIITALYTHSFYINKMSLDSEITHMKLKVSKDDSLREIDKVHRAITQVEKMINVEISSSELHPYFVKQSRLKLESSLADIKDLLDGNNYTNPHNADTFGIEGIKLTNENGIIKATSVVEDYWEDPFAKEYLKVQEELIKAKSVIIQRIFIFPRNKRRKMKAKMQKQKDIGIDVRYIYAEEKFANQSYLKEDYLIQDDSILVQITCDSHIFTNADDKTELITTNKSKINEMNDHYKVLYNRSAKF